MGDEQPDEQPITITNSAGMAAAEGSTFPQLVESRSRWIEDELRPWCRAASRRDLLLAETEWTDLAGTPDPESSLWTWAWGRHPILIHDGLNQMDETREVIVELRDGTCLSGYPDGRSSKRGMLVLLNARTDGRTVELEPVSIDDIAAVRLET